MKQALQIALLGFVGICAVPSALRAQYRDGYRDSGQRNERYERHDRQEHRENYDRDERREHRGDYDRRDYDRYDRSDRGGRYYNQYDAYSQRYSEPYSDRGGYYRPSAGRSAAIIGGTAAAGALIGGAAGRGQGAAIGAVVGGITGLVIDQSTRDHRRYYDRR